MDDVRPHSPGWQVLPSLEGLENCATLPLVSIVVTAFNYERYVAACIESVARQTYSNIQLVVVDDCSTDKTGEIARQSLAYCRRPSFFYVRNSVNLGQLGAQAVGLSRCAGSFVVFLDADDLLLPRFVERHVFFHLNTPLSVSFTAADQVVVDGTGALVAGTKRNYLTLARFRRARLMKVSTDGYPAPMEALFLPWTEPGSQSGWCWGQQSSIMFRRSVLELVMPDLEDCHEFRICADVYLGKFAHLIGNSALLLERLGAYRMHGSNNFSSPSVVSCDDVGGDVSKVPSLATFAKLASSIMARRRARFELLLGHQRPAAVASILASLEG